MLTLAPRNLATFEEAIKDSIGKPRFELWFQGNTRLALADDALEIGVPNRFYREWLESHFQEQIRSAAAATFGGPLAIRFHIDPTLFRRAQESSESATKSDDTQTHAIQTEVTRRLPKAPAGQTTAPRKPTRYSLTRFVVGSANRVAHAAVTAFLDDPRAAHSPLFLHGGIGLGKTHLLKAIALGVEERYRHLKTVYTSCEGFTNEFVEAMRAGRPSGFRRKFRQLDILIVDDVQFLCNKRATQEEFFHTLNALEARGAKVVLSCDVHPRRLSKIGEELKSRFVSGVVAKLETPSLELRRQLLREKGTARGIELRPAVIDFLAEKLCGSICELEGAINYLEHYQETLATGLDVATVRTALAEILRHSVPVLRVPEVAKRFCELFDVNPKLLTARGRGRSITHPRMLFLYLARRYTQATYSEIGAFAGGLKHSTVIAAEHRILTKISQDGEIVLGERPWKARDAVEAFERELGRAPS